MENLVNRFETVEKRDDYLEEHTGLHEREFIETRRCHIRRTERMKTDGSVVQANVVDGRGAIIESPTGAFEPCEGTLCGNVYHSRKRKGIYRAASRRRSRYRQGQRARLNKD